MQEGVHQNQEQKPAVQKASLEPRVSELLPMRLPSELVGLPGKTAPLRRADRKDSAMMVLEHHPRPAEVPSTTPLQWQWASLRLTHRARPACLQE